MNVCLFFVGYNNYTIAQTNSAQCVYSWSVWLKSWEVLEFTSPDAVPKNFQTLMGEIWI